MFPSPQRRRSIRQSHEPNYPGRRRLSLKSIPLMVLHHTLHLRSNPLRTTHSQPSFLPQQQIIRPHTHIWITVHLAPQNFLPFHPNHAWEVVVILLPFLDMLLPTTRRYFLAEQPLPTLQWSLHSLPLQQRPAYVAPTSLLPPPPSKGKLKYDYSHDLDLYDIATLEPEPGPSAPPFEAVPSAPSLDLEVPVPSAPVIVADLEDDRHDDGHGTETGSVLTPPGHVLLALPEDGNGPCGGRRYGTPSLPHR